MRRRKVCLLALAALAGGLGTSMAVCRVTGASIEVIPIGRWGFGGPRTLSLVTFGPYGSKAVPIARVTTVGCVEIWTPVQ
jgi:hypothetical protein